MAKKKVKPNTEEKGLVKASDIKKERRIKNTKRIIGIIFSIILPLLLVFGAQVIQRGDVNIASTWMTQNFGIVLINMAIIYIAFFALSFISKSYSLSFFINSLIYLAIPLISKLKYDVRGEVLLINDLALISNATQVASFAEFSETLITQLTACLITIFLVTIIIKIIKFDSKRITSLVNFLLATAVVVVIFSNDGILKFLGINKNVRFSPNVVHEMQGTLLGLYSNFEMNKVEMPPNYGKEAVYKILEATNTNENVDSFGDRITTNTAEEYPNVIMIMSESFCDPKAIPNVSYSKDPISYIRKLMKEKNTIHGNLITSTFAGGTSNIEYEAFTANVSAFLPYGTVPYTDIMNNLSRVQTIQKVFKENGYKTLAIHSYNGDFYNRNKVYPSLGFDEFKEDKELDDVGYYGKYVGDAVVYKNIIKELEDNKTNKPMFIWALTMQNHTPYTASNIEKEALYIEVSGERISDIAKDKLTGYVNSLYESDRRLELLIDYLKESKKPTVLMFYGDHMPALYEVYYDTKMISTLDTTKWSTSEMKKLHEVPYFIYQNFDNQVKIKNTENVGAYKLGNMLLSLSNVKKSSYFSFIDSLKYIALRDRLFIDEKGNAYEEIQEGYVDEIYKHKLLQYDMIYGNNYVKEFEEEN